MFIGIGLPDECRDAIFRVISPLREGAGPVSWTRAENLHLTLKFLGEVPESRVEELGGMMSEAAVESRPFDLFLEGAGGFPSMSSPRILWVGVREPLDPVRKLHQNMEDVLYGGGFPREGRAYHPHVTVGRVRKRIIGRQVERISAALVGKRFGIAHAGSYRLYESRLSPSGAVHTVLRDVPFGGEPETAEQEGAAR
jgi:RNA 2',3'-cyclic 3'-phosphodiesterase